MKHVTFIARMKKNAKKFFILLKTEMYSLSKRLSWQYLYIAYDIWKNRKKQHSDGEQRLKRTWEDSTKPE